MASLARLFSANVSSVQLTAGRFIGSGASVATGGVGVFAFDINCGVQLRTCIDRKRLLIGIPNEVHGRIIANGRDCDDGRLIVASGCDLDLYILFPASMVWIDVNLAASMSANTVVDVDAAEIADIRAAVREIFALADCGWASKSSVDRTARIKRNIIRAAFAMLRRVQADAETQSEAKRMELVRRAETFMWSSVEEPPTLRQICTAANCKARTLIYAFKSIVGLSPIKYFKILRLNAVRCKLANATNGVRVFDVAADCGFLHMGHFGRDYKIHFGSTPTKHFGR